MEPYDAEAIHIDFAQTRQPVEFKQETIKNIIFPKRQIENERSPPPEIPKKKLKKDRKVTNEWRKELEELELDEFAENEELFKIKKFEVVFNWEWALKSDLCPICRENINDPCLKCASVGVGSEKCPPSTGKCSHSYHKCCLNHWLNQSNSCPMCQEMIKKIFSSIYYVQLMIADGLCEDLRP